MLWVVVLLHNMSASDNNNATDMFVVSWHVVVLCTNVVLHLQRIYQAGKLPQWGEYFSKRFKDGKM